MLKAFRSGGPFGSARIVRSLPAVQQSVSGGISDRSLVQKDARLFPGLCGVAPHLFAGVG